MSGIQRFVVFRLFGPFPAAIPKGMPARLELGCAGMMALLRLAVPWLFDAPACPILSGWYLLARTFAQIKPAKINLSLFGRLVAGAVADGDGVDAYMGGDGAADGAGAGVYVVLARERLVDKFLLLGSTGREHANA